MYCFLRKRRGCEVKVLDFGAKKCSFESHSDRDWKTLTVLFTQQRMGTRISVGKADG